MTGLRGMTCNPHSRPPPKAAVPGTFDLYLVKRFLHTYAGLFVTFYGLYVVIDGFTNMDGFQEGAEHFGVVLARMGRHYGWQSAVLLDLTGPVLLVCTVMVSLALLVRNGELAPMLAAGVPTSRVTRPFLLGTAAMTAVLTLNQEVVLPGIAHELQAPKNDVDLIYKDVEPTLDFSSGVAVNDGRLNLREMTVEEVEFTLPKPDLVSEFVWLRADSATFRPAGGGVPAGWVLSGCEPPFEDLPLTPRGCALVRRVERKDPETDAPTPTGEVFVRSDIDFSQLHSQTRRAARCGTPDLIGRIRNPAFSPRAKREQAVTLHERFRQPVLNLLAVLVAVPLVIRREGRGLIVCLAACSGVMGVLLGVMQGGRMLGIAGLIPADLACWLPVFLVGGLAAALGGKVLT